MPPLPPINFSALFRDPHMFDSKDTFRAAGFTVRKTSAHNIMVGRHPAAPDHLFKKYSRDVPLDKQLANYQSRKRGAKKLRQFITAHQLRHMIVPQKWIYDLPDSFSHHGERSHLLVVERMKLLDTMDNERRYRDIDKDVLKELCVVLHAFRGLDSAIHNVRFTQSGQITFIDTENWERSQRNFFHYIRRELSERSRQRADRMFRKLSRGEKL